jgi:type I restriction enzyme S subunit
MELNMTKYKTTDVGLLPEDWLLAPFEKIFTYYSSSNYSKSQMSEEGDVGCIHYGLVHAIPDTQYDLRNGIKYYVNFDQAKYEFIRDGDVIMVDASEDLEGINKSVEVFGIGKNKYISGLHTYLLRDKESLLSERFRGIVLNSHIVKKQMLQLAVGMKVFGVSKTQLNKILIPLPPTLEEQKAIATALSDVDELISNLDKLIAKKKDIKKGAMQQLLTPPNKGGKHLPGFSGEWETTTLGELCKISRGQLITSNTLVPGEIPVIAGGKKPAYYHNEPNRKGKTITISASGASAGYVSFHDYPIFASDCSTIEESDNYSIEFIYYLLLEIQTLIYFKQTGGAQPHIHPSDLNPIEIKIPKIDDQISIARLLNDMQKEINVLDLKRLKLLDLKQGMMQQLLTGKTRLV